DFAQAVDRRRHVRLVDADDAKVVAVMADGRGDGAALHAEALDERGRAVVVDAVAGDDRDLDDVLVKIDAALAVREGKRHRHAVGDDLARNDAYRLRRRPLPPRDEIGRLDPSRLDAA